MSNLKTNKFYYGRFVVSFLPCPSCLLPSILKYLIAYTRLIRNFDCLYIQFYVPGLDC